MSPINVTFKRPHEGYNETEEAAFNLEAAIKLVALGVAEFSRPDDLEANRVAVEAAKRVRPTPFVRRMIRIDPHRWGR